MYAIDVSDYEAEYLFKILSDFEYDNDYVIEYWCNPLHVDQYASLEDKLYFSNKILFINPDDALMFKLKL